MIKGYLNQPLSQWPDALFDTLGIKNPNAPSNISIVLDALRSTAGIPGDIVECGVYQGSSLMTIGLATRELKTGKRVWGLDSFKGFPKATDEDLIAGVLPEKSQPEYFAGTSQEMICNKIESLSLESVVTIIPGFFEDTVRHFPASRISLLFLDCDLYGSYKTCLNAFYPLMCRGGYIIFDEYYSRKYPGARKAVDEFFAGKPELPMLAQRYLEFSDYERWYTIKS